jgi:hypothetical protein
LNHQSGLSISVATKDHKERKEKHIFKGSLFVISRGKKSGRSSEKKFHGVVGIFIHSLSAS